MCNVIIVVIKRISHWN